LNVIRKLNYYLLIINYLFNIVGNEFRNEFRITLTEFVTKHMNQKKQKGFTLIELLVVISIIAVLSSVTLMILNPQTLRDRAQDSNRKEDLSVIQGALERYYADNNQYPLPADAAFNAAFTTGVAWTNGAITYLNDFPLDPDIAATPPHAAYSYTQTSQQNYTLCATLDAPGPDDVDGNATAADVQFCVQNPF